MKRIYCEKCNRTERIPDDCHGNKCYTCGHTTMIKQPENAEVLGSDSTGLLCAVIELFKGIDEMDGDSPDGWWETSTGAEFGAKKLAELIKIIGT